jgi:uncharacterized protein (TIGR02444 family)
MDPLLQVPTTVESRALDAALWQFMLELYARPGVEVACLEIQEQCGTDIVLLLTWLYHGLTGQEPLGATEIRALSAHVDAWRSRTILPLHRLRVDLREPGRGMPDTEREALRGTIKALELGAERTQVSMIAAWLTEHSVRAETTPQSPLPLLIGQERAASRSLALLHREAALVARAQEVL